MASISRNSWHQLVQELRRSEPAAMRAWLFDIDPPRLQHGILTVRVGNGAQQRHVERFRSAIGRSVQTVLGLLATVEADLAPSPAPAPAADSRDTDLREDFTLDRFIEGPENRMALAAVSHFSEGGGCPYQLLFLHGPRGSGKTHLLHAACHMRRGALEESTAPFVTASRFIGAFTECVELADGAASRRRYSTAEFLALDDVEVFSGKSRSQEELFHVLNSLLSCGGRVLLAADRPPEAIPRLEDRLVSRLSAGMVLAIDPPTLETRLAILTRENERGCYQLSGALLNRIAELCPAEKMDGVLDRVNSLAHRHGGPATMDLVEDFFRESGPVESQQLDDTFVTFDNRGSR